MKWGVFAILLIAAVVLDKAFMQVFAIGSVWPALAPCLVAFVAMHAPRNSVLWAAFLTGLLVDCTSPSFAFFEGARPYTIIGPSALGFTFGAAIVLPLRTMVIRRNPLALGALTTMLAIGAALVTTAILSARGWYAGTVPPWMKESSALSYLGAEALRALGSGAIATLMAFPLNRMIGALGFAGTAPWSPRRG